MPLVISVLITVDRQTLLRNGKLLSVLECILITADITINRLLQGVFDLHERCIPEGTVNSKFRAM